MTTRTGQKTQQNPDSVLVTWEGIQNGDDCAAFIDFSEYDDRTMQVTGTLDGATVAMTGSVNGSDFGTVNDQFGTAMSAIGDEKPRAISEYVYALKPVITGGGASTDITIQILAKRKRKST